METCPCEFNGLRRFRECQRAGLAFSTSPACRISDLQDSEGTYFEVLHSISELTVLIEFS